MKYIKLFMLLAVVSLFAACSSDEDYNTNEVTVGFSNATESVRETAKVVNIPINVKGLRNGDVSLAIKAEGVGNVPAVEDVNYMITGKTLHLNADNQETAVLNVEILPIDDDEFTGDRTFKLTIESANGATIAGNASTTVTIKDNEAAFYERFAGTWTLTGTLSDGETETPFSKDIILSATTDDSKPEYDNILTASVNNLFNIGVAIDYSWHFHYSFDASTKTGTLGFICGEQIASYGGAYAWMWLTDNGQNYTTDDVTATWAVGEAGNLPEITFPSQSTLYFYEAQRNPGPWYILYNIKLTKKQ